jgi:hypothetical protein
VTFAASLFTEMVGDRIACRGRFYTAIVPGAAPDAGELQDRAGENCVSDGASFALATFETALKHREF